MTDVKKIEPTEAHQDFMLDKKEMDDPTIGDLNGFLHCGFCGTQILQQGQAHKVLLDVDMIQNTQREYDLYSTYWHVEKLSYFTNVEVHQIEGNMKYLCCISCQSNIIGYQVITQPNMIFIACDRVEEEK